MKLRTYVSAITPSLATTVSLLILPIVSVIYFWVVVYTERTIASGNYVYVDIDQNFVYKILFGLPWNEWFARSGDFLFWGILATIALIVVWVISSARTSVDNHLVEEEFVNFHVSKAKWHEHYIVALSVKIAIGIIFVYLLATLLVKHIPAVAESMLKAIMYPTAGPIFGVALSAFVLFAVQFLMVVCVKTIKHIEAD